MSRFADAREYTVEMLVEPGSPLVGKRIDQAGLRQLPGLFLVEIDRAGQILPAVSPRERLQGNDRLVFVGLRDSVVDLQKIRGLTPATKQLFKLGQARQERCFLEAVISNSNPLVGKSVREGRFRSRYNAVIIALARNGERVKRKIGDIVLRPGDTLLLESRPAFLDQQRNSRDFFLVSRIGDSHPLNHERAMLAILITALLDRSLKTVAGTLGFLRLGLCLHGLRHAPTAQQALEHADALLYPPQAAGVVVTLGLQQRRYVVEHDDIAGRMTLVAGQRRARAGQHPAPDCATQHDLLAPLGFAGREMNAGDVDELLEQRVPPGNVDQELAPSMLDVDAENRSRCLVCIADGQVLLEREHAGRQTGENYLEVGSLCFHQRLVQAGLAASSGQSLRHVIERTHQEAQFIITGHRQAPAVIPIGHRTRGLGHIPHRCHQPARRLERRAPGP